MAITSTLPVWQPLRPALAHGISDSRLQCHYAAQFATALGISYLAPHADDSHTNLGWDTRHEALASREARAMPHAVQVAIRPRDLTLLLLVDGSIARTIPLHGSTIAQAESTLRSALTAAGLDGQRFTLKRHYELPPHSVGSGDTFSANRTEAFAELTTWYANAAGFLEDFRARIDSSVVRCWPHHFDIATLATIAPGRSSSVGMLPGDEMYPEPYFYVNAYPAPHASRARLPLQGGGAWHTEGWFGAVLTGSRLDPDRSAQPRQVRAFLDSAFDACSSLLRN